MVEVDYAGAVSFVELIRDTSIWRQDAMWPDYLVSEISMVSVVEEWLPNGIVVLEWLEEPDAHETRKVLLGQPLAEPA